MGRNATRWGALLLLLAVVATVAVVTTMANRAPNVPTTIYALPPTQTGPTPTSGAVPACAKVGKPVAIPAEFSVFPLPPGTIIDNVAQQQGSLLMSGFTPYELNSVSGFFQRDMLPAGFKMLEQEYEPGQESEASFKGNGHTGRWKVRPIPDCPGISTLTVSIAR